MSGRRARVQRSVLAVPGSRPELFAKAHAGAADHVFLDLEDSVAPDDKEAAREAVIATLLALDWRARGTVAVRVNGIDTHWMHRDLIAVAERAGPRLDTILVPKVGVPGDVYLVDALLGQIEAGTGQEPGRIGIEALIETAVGLTNVEEVARASPRLEALHFGVADFSASVRMRSPGIGAPDPGYPGDQWGPALSRMVVAARAAGLRALDGPYGDYSDPEGYTASCRRAAALGCEGKWCIHPSQIEAAHAVFTPPPDEVAEARRVLAALEEAAREGRGAASLDGRLIDVASRRMAEWVVAVSEAIEARDRPGGR